MGRLITNCGLLLIQDYMTKIVGSNVIHYIFKIIYSDYCLVTFRLLFDQTLLSH